MKQINPLFISPLIFDKNNINARINSALINSLPEYYTPAILCGDISHYENRFEVLSVNYSLFDKVKIFFLARATHNRISYWPDFYYFYWYKKALNKAEKYLRTNQIDYIHSFSIPYTSHLVAYELKKKYNLPWIAQFYEPWGDNYYRMKSQKVIDFNNKWERNVAANADVIFHNSEIMCESWRERYGDNEKICEKIKYMPMTFEFKGYSDDGSSRDTGRKLHITHIGNFYGLRRALPFFLALNELIKEYPQIKERLNVTMVGDVLQEDVNYARSHNLLDIIDIVGRKSEEECVLYYRKSDLYLVIESEQQGPLFFPSKLIQYYYYNRPILGITTDQSVLFRELKTTGHKAFVPSDINGIKDYLKTALNNYESLLNYNKDAWKRFDSKTIIADYLINVNKIL